MPFTRPTLKLTHQAALVMLAAAAAKAEELDWHVNIVVVDASGVLLGSLRMDNAKFLSMLTATNKATSASSHRRPTSAIDAAMAAGLAAASGGRLTNLAGGLPIVIDGQCVGGIGIGSAPDAEDVAIATAALEAIGATGQMLPGDH